MGRIFDLLRVGDRSLYALFDSGAKHSFVSAEAAEPGKRTGLRQPLIAEIGGKKHRIRHYCLIEGTIRKKLVHLQALVLPEIGADSDGRAIDMIFGADAMQDFGIRLNPEEEQVDLSNYHRTFVEF